MKTIVKYLSAPVLVLALTGVANAADVSVSTNFNVWQGNNPNPGDATDPTQQALPSNPLTSQNFIGFFSYSGPINFSNTSQATDLMSNFIPGVGLPALQMSTPSYDLTTIFEFTFILPTDLSGASILHDDGISLFDITDNTANLIPGAEGPSGATTTALPDLIGGHNYELWYVSANGAPSTLRFQTGDATSSVPEPASWALFIGGFALVGGVMRRRQHQSVRVSFA